MKHLIALFLVVFFYFPFFFSTFQKKVGIFWCFSTKYVLSVSVFCFVLLKALEVGSCAK